MIRYLLDTNIISNLVKRAPEEPLLAWMAERSDADLFIASLTVAEIRRGILEKPAGRKRDELETWFSGPDGPRAVFTGRVLPFDDKAALIWAELMARGKIAGRSRSALDMIIAAVAVANDCTIVTDNDRDFTGLETLNPLRPARQQARQFEEIKRGLAEADTGDFATDAEVNAVFMKRRYRRPLR